MSDDSNPQGGTISQLVHFYMMQPLQNQTAKPPAPVQPGAVGGITDMRVSDVNAKTNIKEGDKQLDNFFSTIGAHEYEYKDKKDGVGKFVSPMAQELEKTTIGKSAVIDTPEGKKVDYPRLTGAALAGLALHHEDIKQINKKLDALIKATPKAVKRK